MELKCKECGASLETGTAVCPNCGCPVERAAVQTVPAVKEKASFRLNILAVAALIFGVVIIFMGMKVMRTSVGVDTFQAKHYNTDSMTFGADFYTEIYRASDTIVDELSELNSGVETISESVAELANVIYETVGTLIVTLGIGVIAVSLCHIKSKA